jgi:hypothetical protein
MKTLFSKTLVANEVDREYVLFLVRYPLLKPMGLRSVNTGRTNSSII